MISVIISTRNRSEYLTRCLSGLAFENANFEVIVIDQGDVPARIPDDRRFMHITSDKRGLSAGRNVGLQAASGDVVAFLDDDAVPVRGYVLSLQRFFQENQSVSAVAGRIISMETRVPYNRLHGEIVYPLINSGWKCFMGGNFAARKIIFDKIGLFDERFGVGNNWAAGEETDIFFRMLYDGLKVSYAPGVKVYHPAEPMQNPSEIFLLRMYSYGKGEGALFAKHLFQYKRLLMLPRFMWSVFKPFVRMFESLFLLKLGKFKIHMRIFTGRICGFLEYVGLFSIQTDGVCTSR